jgi:hypothetical protein
MPNETATLPFFIPPKRTRISYLAKPPMTTCAVPVRPTANRGGRDRMKFTDASNLHRKSGGAQPRDLEFCTISGRRRIKKIRPWGRTVC